MVLGSDVVVGGQVGYGVSKLPVGNEVLVGEVFLLDIVLAMSL